MLHTRCLHLLVYLYEVMRLLKHASKMETKICIVTSFNQRVEKRVTSETSICNADDGGRGMWLA